MTRPHSVHFIKDRRGRPLAFLLGPQSAKRVDLGTRVKDALRDLDRLDRAYLAATQRAGGAS